MALLQIDGTTLGDHYFLCDADLCWYGGDYTARGGFGCSPINNLVSNFKKSVLKRDLPEYYYKERAITSVGRDFAGWFAPATYQQATFVPIPPSKATDHAEYDNRMTLALKCMADVVKATHRIEADVRELVVQQGSYAASHANPEHRMQPNDLIPLYRINEALIGRVPTHIFVVDDVLTTGSHFVAMKTVLSQRFPGVWIGGLFIARRRGGRDSVEPLHRLFTIE